MRVLITGGCGFLGSNLARAGAERGHTVVVLDNLRRVGSAANLRWLADADRAEFIHADVRFAEDVEGAVRRARPDVVFHLAGQVAMTTSLADPRLDHDVNVTGTLNLLEALRRHAPAAHVVFASTNKVYGDLEWVRCEETSTRYVTPDFPTGFDESTPLSFHSPYGCSKGAADQYVLDYARMFGLDTTVFRHSSVFGTRQFSTYDQGWIGWFVAEALDRRRRGSDQPLAVAGTGKQVRDVLFVDDVVDCYFSAVERREQASGEAFNIGGGPRSSLSLLELIEDLSRRLGLRLRMSAGPWRQSDQRVYVSDIAKAERLLAWRPRVGLADGLTGMVEWVTALER